MPVVPPKQLSGFRVYCDESNTDGRKPHPVYGAILVSLDDIREVQRELQEWRHREGMHGELKWEKGVKGGWKLEKYKSLVNLLLDLTKRRNLMHFKAIILDRRAPDYWAYSKGNDELGFYKFYYHWLLRYFVQFPLKHRCQLRVIIDERTIPVDAGDPYTRLKFTLNNGIRKELDGTANDVVTRVHPLKSTQSDLLQAADVLMGAIAFHAQGFHLRPNPNKYKKELARYLAARVGLRDLTRETTAISEYFQITRWYWGARPPRRRKPSYHRPHPQTRHRVRLEGRE